MTPAGRRRTSAEGRTSVWRPSAGSDAAPVAAAAFLLSSAGLIFLSLLVPGYIRPEWATAFALSGVPCVVVGVLLLLRRRLSGLGVASVVLYGDAAILLSAFASADRVGTTAGALLSLPMLFTSTFLRPRWLFVQAVLAAGCAWVIVSLVPAPHSVHLIRTTVLVVACVCPAVIVALLRVHLDRAVQTDPLTGLLNRRALVAHFPDHVAVARRAGMAVAVLLVDIDHFKQVNDRYGHLTGDEALQRVAGAVVQGSGRDALVVRLGGEELAVVLVASTGEVRDTAERIRRRVEDEAATWHLTVSIGCSWARPDDREGDLLDHLLREADGRMYEAKRSGRNRVVHPGVRTG